VEGGGVSAAHMSWEPSQPEPHNVSSVEATILAVLITLYLVMFYATPVVLGALANWRALR
jgi:hypothetical protein